MSERALLNTLNSAIVEARTKYINAKKEYLTAKNNLAEAEAQISLTDKETWKDIGITNKQEEMHTLDNKQNNYTINLIRQELH